MLVVLFFLEHDDDTLLLGERAANNMDTCGHTYVKKRRSATVEDIEVSHGAEEDVSSSSGGTDEGTAAEEATTRAIRERTAWRRTHKEGSSGAGGLPRPTEEKPPFQCNRSDIETSTISIIIAESACGASNSQPTEKEEKEHSAATAELVADRNLPGRSMSVSNAAALSLTCIPESSSSSCCGIIPFPLFLVQLWLLDWERQHRLTQTTRPLPLHNPSSFCFFSSVLHALASLPSVVDLAYTLAFFRLLQKNLAHDGAVAFKTQLPASADQSRAKRNDVVHFNRQANSVTPYKQGSTPKECFPLSLYRCLLALNRGRIKGSFCRTSFSCAACVCNTRVSQQVCHVGSGTDSTAQTGYPQAYGGSLLDPLFELAANIGMFTAKEINRYNTGKPGQTTNISTPPSQCTRVTSVPCPSETAWAATGQEGHVPTNEGVSHCDSHAPEQLSHDKRFRPDSSYFVAHGNVHHYSILASAAASSIQALEDEWRLSSALHNPLASAREGSEMGVVAMYRELMRAIKCSADSFGCHSAFGTLLEDARPAQVEDRHIRDQDSHEFLHLLIEEIERECEATERIQELLKKYLDPPLPPISLNKEVRADTHRHQRSPENCSVSSHECHHTAHRPPMDCAVTTPMSKNTAGDFSGDAAHSKDTSVEGGGGTALPSEFFRCKGYLWSLIPQSQLKSGFIGTLQESLRCLKCGVFSPERPTPFWCLHVTLSREFAAGETSGVTRSSVTLEQLLRAALGPQRLEDVECTYCSVSATVVSLQNQMRASPTLAALKMGGDVAGSARSMAVGEALPAGSGSSSSSIAAVHDDEDTLNNMCSVIRATMKEESQRPSWEVDEPLSPCCTLGSRHLPSSPDGSATEVIFGETLRQNRPAGRSAPVATSVDKHAVEGSFVEETTEKLHDGDVPGLFSPFWFLPASVVLAWVRRWRLLFRLRRFLALWRVPQGFYGSLREGAGSPRGRKYNSCQGGNRHAAAAVTGAVHATGDSPQFVDISEVGSQQQTPALLRQSTISCPSSSFGESLDSAETDEDLRLAAGDLWVVKRRPKEKLQRIERMPSVLIIQVNALTVTRGGRLLKEQARCVFPFLLDTTFMTRAFWVTRGAPPAALKDKIKPRQETTSPVSWLHADGVESEERSCRDEDEVKKICRERSECVDSHLDSTGAFRACRQEASSHAVAQGTTLQECWCRLEHLYGLRAVITHAGTASSAGHFACYRRWDAHAFIPGTAWCFFVRQFLTSISPATHNAIVSGRTDRGHADAGTLTVDHHYKDQQNGERHRSLRDRVRQWLLYAACTSYTRSSFAWISDDCVRSASFAEVQAAQPYLLFYEKVSPSVF